MPDDRLDRTRRAYTDSPWPEVERVARLYQNFLSENVRSGRFPFTPHGLAACIDDAVGRAVYETVYSVEDYHVEYRKPMN